MISLPDRSDKRDSLVVQASLSNFSVTFVDGIDGATISDKAVPYVSESTVMSPRDKAISDSMPRHSSREGDRRDAGEDIWTLQKGNQITRSSLVSIRVLTIS